MENQGKRLLLAVVLALAILIVWQWLFPSKPSQPSKKTDETAQQNYASPVGIPTGASEAPEAPVGPEEITAFDYPNVHVEISNRDAKIVSWKLLDPKYAK